MAEASWDCIVVGAGPGGLTAALYLARYRRRVLVVHDGKARALRIPLTHNVPGFPEGVCGTDLIEHMTEHATRYGAEMAEGHVARIVRGADGLFTVATDEGAAFQARSVILATGLFLNQIDIPWDLHEAAIRAGVLRYCPVCDAYEHSDKRVGVVGGDLSGAAEALFMRQYTDRVTLMPCHGMELTAQETKELAEAGIAVVRNPITRYEPASDEMRLHLEGLAEPLSFDVLYPALGVSPRTRLAGALGVPVDDKGRCPADAIFATDVPGVWCAGDIVEGLDQISVAMGHGAIASTKAHNWLREQDGQTIQTVADFEEPEPVPVAD